MPRLGGVLDVMPIVASLGHFLAAVHENRTIVADDGCLVLYVGLAAVGQGHDGSSKQAQVPVPWPESNCASPMAR